VDTLVAAFCSSLSFLEEKYKSDLLKVTDSSSYEFSKLLNEGKEGV